MRDGTQQRLATLCVCATWCRVDARAQDRCKGTHRPIVVPTCEGRDAAQAAVLQRVRIRNEGNAVTLFLNLVLKRKHFRNLVGFLKSP